MTNGCQLVGSTFYKSKRNYYTSKMLRKVLSTILILR